MNWRNVFLITKREYLQRVRTRAFIISTILMPVIMFGFSAVPMLMGRVDSKPKNIVIVSDSAAVAEQVANRIRENAKDAPGGSAKVNVTVSSDVSDEARTQLVSQVQEKKLDSVLWLTMGAIEGGKVEYHTRETSDLGMLGTISRSVNQGLQRQRLTARGLNADEIESIYKPARVEQVQVRKEGGKKSDPIAGFIIPIAMTMMLYITMLVYGAQVMQSVVEEKTSRVVEVMLSCVSAKDMMGGKLLGAAATGVTQLIIWLLAATVISAPAMFAGQSLMQKYNISVSPLTLILVPVMFLCGFLLYSTLFAAVGASVNSMEETQNLAWVVNMPVIASFIITMAAIRQPESTFTVVCSFIPFFAPLVMFVRTAVQEVPLWQIGVSIAGIAVTWYVMVSFCAKIYRVGILMYGKRPTLPEIIKWAKYAN